ncbi:rhodanese-like domain-containing protein [Natronospira bacteriovora]|uniref:Rhodanese-like domain-containing protein n=1 Tax=Natronospira bacteriovora TaxID=3069753 RepID=A0ABU0W762_9GAMM|nr:rhodanese-like domain-containing protein [Natronospira sp. AB-CW4]MDQ2069866.1 rhodanese-like domain-containing protein [Natronospira sp. AB-CW4]
MEKLLEFASEHTILVLALVTVFVLFVFSEIRRGTRPFRDVEPGQATRLINDGAVVVDLRQPDAYRNGHIAGAANYPGDRIEAHVDDIRKRLKKAHQQPLLVYCDTGMTSARPATWLARQELGVEVINLKGGVTAWQRENLPLKKG